MPHASVKPISACSNVCVALSATPTVRSCKLASTRKGTGQDEGAIFFEMAVEVVRLPGSSMLAIDETWEDGK